MAQIAKSLVFTVNGAPMMVVAAGANRVDEAKVGRLAGGTCAGPIPSTVKQATGYTIGGVPPIAHAARCPSTSTATSAATPSIYAAAGLPECVFPADAGRAGARQRVAWSRT